jgi:hypothetical protein
MAAISARSASARGCRACPLPSIPSAAPQATSAAAEELADQDRLLLMQAGHRLDEHARILQVLAAGLAQLREIQGLVAGPLL